ncbi:Major facilitator superfamily domain general substrate transporter [Penicillium herquei]|nr:Major facilitator superfamily domain general substrate transporter [Penicillium herquei]
MPCTCWSLWLRAFGSAPLVCSAAALVDIWSPIERNYAFPFFSIVAFLGATAGPVPGSIISWTHVSWRYVDWITIALAGLIFIPTVFFLPETYSPIILHWKAKHLRHLTQDDRYRAPIEFKPLSFSKRLRRALYRPCILLWTEPIIIIFSGYLGIIFIVLYTFSSGFPSIFEKVYKLNGGELGPTSLSIAVGVLLTIPLIPCTQYLIRRDIYRARAQNQSRPGPEFNLYLSMFTAPFFAISLFWMGWTSRPEISLWCPLGAAAAFGFGALGIFVSSYQYVAAAFENVSASALASLQLFRLVAAGVMACIAQIMYHNLGVAWTMTLLGCIATFFLPVPYLLYLYGPYVRGWSRRAGCEG